MGQFNNDLQMYRTALQKDFTLSEWYQPPVWGDLMGYPGGKDQYGYPTSVPYGALRNRTVAPSGKPIEVLLDWFHEGGWDMDIPVLLPLVEEPRLGDQQAKGYGEDRRWVYRKGYFTQIRKPVKVSDGSYGEMAINPKLVKRLLNRVKTDLQKFNTDLMLHSPYQAMYRGFDNNLIGTPELSDICVQTSHPNFFIEGYGKVAYNTNNATYETAIAALLANLGAGDEFTMKTLRKMQMAANELTIGYPTVSVMGHPIKGVAILNDRQFAQLAEDPLFEKIHIALITADGNKAAMFTGAYEAHLVEGVLILVDVNNPGIWLNGDTGYDATRGIINYGNPNPIRNPIHNSDIKLALYMGASALLCANNKQLRMEDEIDDFGNIKETASITARGFTRADNKNTDRKVAAADFLPNSSSLVVATYTPQNIAWGTGGASS